MYPHSIYFRMTVGSQLQFAVPFSTRCRIGVYFVDPSYGNLHVLYLKKGPFWTDREGLDGFKYFLCTVGVATVLVPYFQYSYSIKILRISSKVTLYFGIYVSTFTYMHA